MILIKDKNNNLITIKELSRRTGISYSTLIYRYHKGYKDYNQLIKSKIETNTIKIMDNEKKLLTLKELSDKTNIPLSVLNSRYQLGYNTYDELIKDRGDGKFKKGHINKKVRTLKNEDVIEIKKRLMSGETGKQISKDYGVSDTAINFILNERSYADIEVEGFKEFIKNRKPRHGIIIPKEVKQDISDLMDRGLTNKEISDRTGISTTTILRYRELWRK